MGIAAIVLAAGSASRYGSPKPLEWIAGETFVGRAVRISEEAGFQPVLAVVHDDAVARAARGGGSEAVFNDRWETGLAASIAAGIDRAASDPGVEAALILGCDQVVVTADDLRRLRSAFDPEAFASAADYGNGAFGVPAIFGREAFPALSALEGDAGAKSLLEQHRERVCFVSMPSAALDVDRPEDRR
ncbi:MAG TPA: nucleotidyltransferase family protein [Thermoanaerobaculia bacterium]|nr:nucleotidyltransferase family protein [Thermoanaerobaculia bacterium]